MTPSPRRKGETTKSMRAGRAHQLIFTTNATMSFQSLLSTFKAATGDPLAGSASRKDSHTKTNGKSPASDGTPSKHISAKVDTKPKTNTETSGAGNPGTAASLAPSQSNKSLIEATTDLWRIAEIRRSAAGMRKAALGSTSSSSTVSDSTAPNGFHMAVCACVVDELPHEEVWRRFMQNDTFTAGGNGTLSASAELYIHAKHPDRLRSSWARSKTIGKCFSPNWHDVRIVRAMLALAEEALSDQRTTHILFATESCIPIATLGEVAKRIVVEKSGHDKQKDKMNWNRSFVDAYGRNSSRCTRFDERNCWDALVGKIPPDAIQKALPGWCLMSRKHIESILNLPQALGGQDLWPAFTDVWAPEEVYFPTCLTLCGYLAPGSEADDDIVREPLTYSEWNERARDHKDRAHPLVFDGVFEDDTATIRRIRDQGCTFLRKVKRPVSVHLWEDVVAGESHGRGRPAERQYQGRGRDGSYESSSGRKRNRQDYDGRGRDDYYGRGRGDDSNYYGHSRQRRY